MAAKGSGGSRKRHTFKKEQLGSIDREAISSLLRTLAPNVAVDRQAIALAIVVKGIEIVREIAPNISLTSAAIRKYKSAIKRLKTGKTKWGPPFNSFVRKNGRLYGTREAGLYQEAGLYRFEDVPVKRIKVTGFPEWLYSRLHIMAEIEQRAAGFKNINPNILCNPTVEVKENGSSFTLADQILDDLIKSLEDCKVELASCVYFAITAGLGVNATTSWCIDEPKKMRDGRNFGRLFVLAAKQAHVPLLSSRSAMQGVLKRGKAKALKPAITYSDGRSFTDPEILFQDCMHLPH